ncbi:hypothetical protein EON65_48660, partial [archaeon]
MHTMLMRTLLLFMLMVLTTQAQQRIWTRVVGTTSNDVGYGVSVDPSTGAVYVAGSAYSDLHGQTNVGIDDIILIKYDSNGTRVWTKMVGTTGSDVANGVSVDPSSSGVYVTGYVAAGIHGQTFAGTTDAILIKYASNGTRIWTRLIGSNSWDQGNAVSVDPSTASIYVTGYAMGSLFGEMETIGSEDLFLAKYTSSGTRLWTKVVGTLTTDIGFGMSVHTGTGDVYVTGRSSASLHGEPYVANTDIVLLKYASNGTRVWTRMVGTSGNDNGRGISVDSSTGDVYVTGFASAALHGEPHVSGNDIFLIKYASNGTRVWTRMVGTSGNDIGFDVVVDKITSTVYITGQIGDALHGEPYLGSDEVFIIAYSSNGTRLWTKMMGTANSDRGEGIAVNINTQVVYFTGYASGILNGEAYAGQADIFTVSFTGITIQPSGQPTGHPSMQPTSEPSCHPSTQPSMQPTLRPTCQPAGQPSEQPASQPTGQPSIQPSSQPSGQPSYRPSMQPSRQPTGQPIVYPSSQPTSRPSGQPTRQPSCQPTRQPSMQPTSQPSSVPSFQPTSQPSGQPSDQPSLLPSSQPTGKPSSQPSGQPSCQPSCQPTCQPTDQPSGQPNMQPTSQPTNQPTVQPTSQP